MFRDQAHHILFGLLLYNTFCKNLCSSNDLEPKITQNDNYDTSIEVLDYVPHQIPLGKNVTLICKTNLTDVISWSFNGDNITDSNIYTQILQPPDEDNFSTSQLLINSMDFNQVGTYVCLTNTNEPTSIVLNITVPARVLDSNKVARIKLHETGTLYCVLEGYPLNNVRWFKKDDRNSDIFVTITDIQIFNETVQNVTLNLEDIKTKNNGEYICEATGANDEKIFCEVLLKVLEKPQVQIDTVKALGTNMIFLNWTVNDGNDPENLKYIIQYLENDDDGGQWWFHKEQIKGSETYAVLEDRAFKNNTWYSIRMEAVNSEGASMKSKPVKVKTLEKDPVFIPEVKVTGVTVSSITVSWTPLPLELFNYYQLKLWPFNSTTPTEAIHSTPGDHLYMFRDLAPATMYEFQVAACSEYTKTCGNWSAIINGTTNDGISDPPENVNLSCNYDNVSHTSSVYVSWKPPKNPNGKITHYNIRLEGQAEFINEQGSSEYTTWGPKLSSISEKLFHTRFYNMSANTNYTVKISAVTRMKKYGKYITKHCTLPPTTPDKNKMSRFSLSRVDDQGKLMFKLFLPRISERNGAICCYRIYMIRMEPYKGLAELPSPEDLPIGTYSQAHRTPKGGAYVAEMFSSESFHSEVFLGDDQIINYESSPCLQCLGISKMTRMPSRRHPTPTTTTTPSPTYVTTTIPTTVPGFTEAPEDDNSAEEGGEVTMKTRRSVREELDYILPHDGLLDISSNYTGFVEVIVYGLNKGEMLAAYSNYFSVLNPGSQVIEVPPTQILGIVIQILCALILVVLVLLMALCVLHRYTKQVAHAQGIEMITFRNSFRHLCRSLRGRHRLVSLSPSDMSPIAKAELVSVYIERHRDSDYGFQREFELLPDRFNDRTTRASEARENIYKNRYPDIKAYDQSRVKLAQVDSIAGSDYINANFVIGYKERKKFICAQGPMDNTVCDYWRMIWEQHLEIILMLTNLEEYSKTKCAKYWPDKTEGEKTFGDITVTHTEEKRCSDYIIRQLKITRQNTGRAKDERFITQYHYLVWKDFMAPEHPHGIIKFIKRMNEAYSLEKGSILVHCSAGVGRTGTLVALDSLLQQLAEEGQVAIFNTVCDLRHQRNFLVQSLKQYIFIYRALMEVAQYGDTEIQATELKTIVDKLKRSESGRSKMEEDYEKIKNVIEDRKSFTVGGGEENNIKNRSELVIPYDRNRVILTPIPGREHSTYINASFIEGYDNSESFIITQDPLEQTIADFWRMISEQGICTIVMLSNLGDSAKKCPRYWPDDEIAYDHILVKYIQSESCPYYTRREFIVTNNKSDEKVMVTQFQYHGWPTVEGEVPEVTRGLIELVDQTQAVQTQHEFTAPVVIHCNFGSDRSSMFVGLSILVQQLRVEKRVDVFTTTRKLRSQRQGMISTFAQYEFLHRAIMNYADLHQLCDNSVTNEKLIGFSVLYTEICNLLPYWEEISDFGFCLTQFKDSDFNGCLKTFRHS